MIRKVSLSESFATIVECWSPHVAGHVNDCAVKLAKLKGDFVWHHHEHEDELFLVVKGTLCMRLRDGDIDVQPGEFIIIPRGVEHCPVAQEEVHVLLFEPASTRNTGNVTNERTLDELRTL